MSSTNATAGFSGEQLVDASTNAVETSVYDIDTISQLDETSPLIETSSHQAQKFTGGLFTKSIQTAGKTSPLVKTSAQSMMTSVKIDGTISPAISMMSTTTGQPGAILTSKQMSTGIQIMATSGSFGETSTSMAQATTSSDKTKADIILTTPVPQQAPGRTSDSIRLHRALRSFV